MSCIFFFSLWFFLGGVEGLSFEAVLSQILCWLSTWYVDEGELEVMILLPAFASAGSAARTTEPTETAVHNLKSVGVMSSLWSQLLGGAIGSLDYVVRSSQNNFLLRQFSGVSKNIVLLLSLFLISSFLCYWELLFILKIFILKIK